MRKNTWMIIGIINIILLAAMAAASYFLGGCTGMIECGDKSVPMKCHWTYIATGAISIGAIIPALLSLLAKTKEGRYSTALCTLVAVGVALAMTVLIGLCGDTAMKCHQTALVVRIIGGLSILVSIVQIVKADPKEAEKPKLGL